ncbi:Maf family protein [Paenibacillus sp. J5C_2022]|uniref:Maf family protein n=1 Tax=Paenibacillus sp. J5C2022 TaxID=2977129 RepID=UPI0021D00E73|nr:Maf family protein [Paenibacillus sp. J5C2022]MCU6711089.1 Maf family protein [Paenibacillus sp. J5C2022]
MTDQLAYSHPISRIVLASSSPRRKELVAAMDLSLPVSILSADVEEWIDPSWSSEQAVQELAIRKGNAVRDRLRKQDGPVSSDLVIAADTIVVLDGIPLGKPEDDGHAREMLTALQGRWHEVYTGVACLPTASGEDTVCHRLTKVHMKPLSQDNISRYIATGEPRDKAGGYGIQGLGSMFIHEIEGCYFNVVGLPVSLLSDMLRRYGIEAY